MNLPRPLRGWTRERAHPCNTRKGTLRGAFFSSAETLYSLLIHQVRISWHATC